MKPTFFLWTTAALANPLRLDVNVQLDVSEGAAIGQARGGVESKQSPKSLPPVLHKYLADDLPVVELPYAKHKASPPLTVRT